MRRILIGVSRHIEYDMRNDFFAHLEKLPLAYFQTHRTGDLMSRATNDLNAVRMMIGPSVMYSANTLLTFVVALAMMVSIDARLTLLSLIPLPFASFSVKYFGSAIHKRFEQIPRSAPSRRKRSRACGWCAPIGRKPRSSNGSVLPMQSIWRATGG
jgi:ATP-binding cassette subfamily B protein